MLMLGGVAPREGVARRDTGQMAYPVSEASPGVQDFAVMRG